MKKYAWLTDSSVCQTEDLLRHDDFHCIPISIILDGEVYQDAVDLTEEELFHKLKKTKNPPTTSQPPIGEFIELYQNLKEEYKGAFVIHISEALSGTYSTSIQAANLVRFPCEVIDSKILSLPMTEMIRRGMALEKEGKKPTDIAQSLRDLANRSETYVVVGSLEQLKRSGRINHIQYYLGTLIKLVPIIAVEDGKLIVFDKKRTYPKAMDVMLHQLKKAVSRGNVRKVFILHGNALDRAMELKEEIYKIKEDVEIEIGPLCAAICVHAGEGTIGISWFNE